MKVIWCNWSEKVWVFGSMRNSIYMYGLKVKEKLYTNNSFQSFNMTFILLIFKMSQLGFLLIYFKSAFVWLSTNKKQLLVWEPWYNLFTQVHFYTSTFKLLLLNISFSEGLDRKLCIEFSFLYFSVHKKRILNTQLGLGSWCGLGFIRFKNQ